MKRLSQAVICGGGVSQLLDEGSLPLPLLESSRTCVLDLTSGSSQAMIPPALKTWVDSVGQILHRKGLRFITESEIGLAAIHVSIQTYCNPCTALHSGSVKGKPGIASVSLSQKNAVDETALAAASQNITAYVVNTELSQEPSRLATGGISAVNETPEKTEPKGKTSEMSKMPSLGSPFSTRVVNETIMSSESVGSTETGKRMKKASGISEKGRECSVKLSAPPPRRTTGSQALQNQTALTNFFQPISKKRPHEDTISFGQPEAKLLRKKKEDEILKSSDKPQKLLHNQQSVQNGIYSFNSDSKKRKEPEREASPGPAEPEAAFNSDLSLDEIESIMSEEMDEPPQTLAHKKQRLELEPVSASSNKQAQSNLEGTDSKNRQRQKNQQSSSRNIQRLEMETTARIFTKHDAKRNSRSAVTDTLEVFASTEKGANQEEVKEEEVSFVMNSRTLNEISLSSEAALKQEMQVSTTKSGAENDPEFPWRLLQVPFVSLTVSTPSRPKPTPRQPHDTNDKNVKRFCKKNVPGSNGLPKIIGGSDLVTHSHSKNSELEEWLRDAAEKEKQNEKEESLGNDLFRYNPRPAKKR